MLHSQKYSLLSPSTPGVDVRENADSNGATIAETGDQGDVEGGGEKVGTVEELSVNGKCMNKHLLPCV